MFKAEEIHSPLNDDISPFGDIVKKGIPSAYVALRDQKINDKRFKHAKYVVISKVYESDKVFRLYDKIDLKTKVYAIGILTTDNRYYYNLFKCKTSTISTSNTRNLKAILTRGYIYDNTTEVLFSDNISKSAEPPKIFMEIIQSVVPFKISYRPISQQLATINHFIKYIKPKYGSFSFRHHKKLIEWLIHTDRLAFCPDNELKMMRNLMPPREFRSKLKCAIGIFYLYARQMDRIWSQKSRGKKKQKDTQYNITKEIENETK